MVPKIGITPTSEFFYFICDQHLDRLPQLFLKEPCVKTHTCEHSFGVTKHGPTKLMYVGDFGYANYNVESNNSTIELKEKLNLSPQLIAQHMQ